MNELVKSFRDIFRLEFPLAIHKSQRPYVWDIDKANRLIEDLEDFQKRCKDKDLHDLPYYMGTIVLYKNMEGKCQLEVIDGQQRLTTLLLMDYYANKEQSILCQTSEKVIFEYSSNISAKNIQHVKSFLAQHDVTSTLVSINRIISDRLVFTVINVETEDEAFTYFDTQNNRGKKPSIDVVLKAVHLRGIVNDEKLQKECAERWESIEHYAEGHIRIPGESEGFLYPFIKTILWRSRAWKFSNATFCNETEIENTFSRSLPTADSNTILFFPHSNNHSHQELQMTNGALFYNPKPINLSAFSNVENLPFQLRQPLKKGYNFFLYIEKYALIYKQLFADSAEEKFSKEVKAFKQFYSKIYTPHSVYMQQYYMLCIMMYYDKFKEDGLLKFAFALDYLVGAERLSNYYIVAVKYINVNNSFNVLDAIHMAYSPQEVIDFIVNNKEIENKKIGAVNKIMTSYLYELKHYFEGGEKERVPDKITESATNKLNEISKSELINELNMLTRKRKKWLLKKLCNAEGI